MLEEVILSYQNSLVNLLDTDDREEEEEEEEEDEDAFDFDDIIER